MKNIVCQLWLILSILTITNAFCPAKNETADSPKQWVRFQNSTTENTTEAVAVDRYLYVDGKSGFYKDRPQQLLYLLGWDVWRPLNLSMSKLANTHPNFTEEYHKNLTRHTLVNGFDFAVKKYKEDNPFWAGTLDWYLRQEHSKKNIEEYYWI